MANVVLQLLPGVKEQNVRSKVLIAICAYNEGMALASLLSLLAHKDVLVVDDGSKDSTRNVIYESGVRFIIHPTRMGKSASLQDITDYAREKEYDYVVELDADALPSLSAIPAVLKSLQVEGIGGVSVRQIPVGPKNLAYYIDDLIWAILNHGKSIQLAHEGTCHLGGVMYAFKTKFITRVAGAVNDDEQLGVLLRVHGQRITYVSKASVFFDASTGIGHILERRRRMIVGHYAYSRSSAPGMQHRIAVEALVRATIEMPSRLPWVIPALLIEAVSRILAFGDARSPEIRDKYVTWATSYRKNVVTIASMQS